eukprot:4485553-Pleurochrysis_carterae.AAC.1
MLLGSNEGGVSAAGGPGRAVCSCPAAPAAEAPPCCPPPCRSSSPRQPPPPPCPPPSAAFSPACPSALGPAPRRRVPADGRRRLCPSGARPCAPPCLLPRPRPPRGEPRAWSAQSRRSAARRAGPRPVRL